jgi:hypothetical protein
MVNASAGLPCWCVIGAVRRQSYALFSAALLLFSGALGDQFVRKKIFVLGVAE